VPDGGQLVDRDNRTAEQIAEKHDQLIEFGRSVKLLRETADHLERNGHTTVRALEAVEEVKSLLETVAHEEHEQSKRAQRLYEEHVNDGHDHYVRDCPVCEDLMEVDES